MFSPGWGTGLAETKHQQGSGDYDHAGEPHSFRMTGSLASFFQAVQVHHVPPVHAAGQYSTRTAR